MSAPATNLLRLAVALLMLYAPVASALQVAAPFVELRTGPGQGYPVFHIAKRGEQLTALQRRADWYQVETERGVAGWMSAGVLDGQITGPSAPRPNRLGVSLGGGRFAGDPLAYVRGGYRPLPWLTTELLVADIAGRYSNSRLYGARLSFSTNEYWRMTPYATLGAGLFRNTPRGTLLEDDSLDAPVTSFGGGVRVALHPRLDVAGEYVARTVAFEEGTESYVEWSLALLAWF